MLRIWRIFWHEYYGSIRRRSYLLFTFGFPIFMLAAPALGGLILGLAIQSALPELDLRPVGVIDQADLFPADATAPAAPVQAILFTTPEDAQQAFEQSEIQAYYDIQPDYWQSGEVILTYDTAPISEVDDMVRRWINRTVRGNVAPEILSRFDQGATITHQDLSGTRSFSLENFVELALVFLPIYFVRLGSSFMAEYMFGSIASEAHDRTMEILITSVSTLQLILGKLLGLLAVGLTQLGTWIGFVLILGAGVGYIFGFNLIGALLAWEHLFLMVTVLLAAYIMDQILAATLALFRVSGGAGSMLFNTMNWIVGLGLIYAIYFIPRSPNTPLAIAASIFPITASVVLLIRVVVTEVPLWQIALAQLSLWGTIIGSVFWLRWLLKANLVSNVSPVTLKAWLVRRLSWGKGRVVAEG